MAGKVVTCMVSSGVGFNCRGNLSPSLSTSCKMQRNPRNFNSSQHKRQVKKVSPDLLPSNKNIQSSADVVSSAYGDLDVENSSVDRISTMNDVPACDEAVDSDDNIDEEPNSLTLLSKIKDLSIDPDNADELTGTNLQDLVGMIRNAEKNIILLNQARVRTLEDIEKISSEKQALQGEINSLEVRLAETDEKMKIAAQEKIRVEVLEDQLEKLRHELSMRGDTWESTRDVYEEVHLSSKHGIDSLTEELSLVRKENESLKDDLESVKKELTNVKGTNERVQFLERERCRLETSLKELELKLNVSQDDVSELSNLKFNYNSLSEKVETLQALLDKTTKQADHAIVVLQQNKELRNKVDKLEESLEEANAYKSSTEKLQKYNELMQKKIKLLEEHLERSDEEIHSYVKLYQESVEDFQDTLNNLKEESKRRSMDETVDDMPYEFWSRLLLMIDGWFLEKKISSSDAQILREMAWKRNRRIYDAYMASKSQNENKAISTFLNLTSSTKSAGLHVIHIAAEMAPAAKVGGLGDVVTGLGKALQKRGHLVEIVLPKYDCMQHERVRDLRVLDMVVESYFDGHLFKNKVWVGTVEGKVKLSSFNPLALLLYFKATFAGLPVYLIEPQHPAKFFWRGQFYGENDDFKRFSFFSRAALELILQAGKKPDIIHCHDWHTAFVAPLYWDLYVPKGLNSARICFTCHNFEYQGTAPASDLASCGLDVNQLNRPDRMQDNSSHDRINPVKGAIVYSNIVTTVSPTYAEEVRTAKEGQGLHGTLNSFAKKFVGILNGIDTDAWNPSTDTFIKFQYSVDDLRGKAENKEALRSHLGLSQAPRKPMVACITRLVPQKGVHLIRHAIYRTMELGGQFVLLGSSPVPHIQREFEDIASKFRSHEHVRLILKYDESLSHSIYAASDMFIIPSIFEPCGLTQMISMRYGAIPIVRKTGGLNDSVFDVHDDAIQMQFRNGFTFLTPDEQGLNSALDRAFEYYNKDNQSWEQLVQKVMNLNYSWDSSAAQYEDLYEKSVSRARAIAS